MSERSFQKVPQTPKRQSGKELKRIQKASSLQCRSPKSPQNIRHSSEDEDFLEKGKIKFGFFLLPKSLEFWKSKTHQSPLLPKFPVFLHLTFVNRPPYLVLPKFPLPLLLPKFPVFPHLALVNWLPYLVLPKFPLLLQLILVNCLPYLMLLKFLLLWLVQLKVS
jgi:hypothetical protein